MGYSIVANNSQVFLNSSTSASSSYTASLTNSTFQTDAGTKIFDYNGIEAFGSRVFLFNTNFTSPLTRILSAEGGEVQISTVSITFSSTTPLKSVPTISLSGVHGNITNFQTIVTFPAGLGMNRLPGFAFVRSQILMSNVQLLGMRSGQPIDKGGALFAVNSTLQIAHSLFQNCEAKFGGAIYAESSTVNIDSSYIIGNYATSFNDTLGSGGGCYFNETEVSMTSSFITSNVAGVGGGVYIEATSYPTVYFLNTNVSANSAQSGGGIAIANNSFVFANSCPISFNVASNNGGAVLMLGGQAEFDVCGFFTNKASEGGAFYVSEGSTTLIGDSTITDTQSNHTLYMKSFIETTLILRFTTIHEHSALPSDFCCNSTRRPTPNGEICNFPACNDTTCKEAVGCNCPFSSTINLSTPVLPTTNYNCSSCHPQYADPFCFVENKCLPQQPNSCTTNQTCTNSLGYYDCSCKPGYSEPFCEDIDECLTNNGGCDKRVSCINTIGSRTCGKCPNGFLGSGYSICKTSCGDGACNATIGENCVSCPLDCRTQTCGVCGDGQCDSPGETCNNCFEDCHEKCGSPSCATDCTAHGTCVAGLCVCIPPWTGPSCNDQAEPISVLPNSTFPNVTIQPILPPTQNTQNVSFSVFLRSFREMDPNGALVNEIFGANFTFTNFTSNAEYLVYEFSSILDNQASVNITFIQFITTATYYFYGVATTYPANTVKMNARIANWPFLSIVNTLEAIIESKVGNSNANECFDSKSQGPWLTWTKLSFGGVSIFAQFSPEAYVDGRERSISFVSLDQNTVAAQIPHFWTYAELDPSFAVLLDPESRDGCGKIRAESKKSNTVVVFGFAVFFVFFVLIFLVFYLIYRHRRMKKVRTHLRTASEIAQNKDL
eukprot:Phypoly_transcript_01205.p1 GENE.Phypoly_transcript_01205~~Phypoly_transcript_01205.p1  ORF type:complete len:1009 (-),score=91.48 Phypoly_transcript_01205:560-3226(-)